MGQIGRSQAEIGLILCPPSSLSLHIPYRLSMDLSPTLDCMHCGQVHTSLIWGPWALNAGPGTS